MTDDLSRKTIVALVLLTVVISILGTWIVLEETSNIKVGQEPTIRGSTAQGKIELEITGPKEKTPVSKSTGQVTLEIL